MRSYINRFIFRNTFKVIQLSVLLHILTKVSIINYRNSPVYVQKIINKILYSFRKFYKIYVDNIIIFLSLIKKHIKHLKLIFDILINMNIHLLFHKSFFDYSLIHLFK